MKKLLLFLFGCIFSLISFSQTSTLEFAQKKVNGDRVIIYFDVVGISNEQHANTILQSFLDNPNIEWGRFYESSAHKDRFHLITNHNITAHDILDILVANGVDFDYSSVMRNGVLEQDPKAVATYNSNVNRSTINAQGFPQYKNTGNPLEDEKRYTEEKQKWIEENPEAYQQMLNDLQK